MPSIKYDLLTADRFIFSFSSVALYQNWPYKKCTGIIYVSPIKVENMLPRSSTLDRKTDINQSKGCFVHKNHLAPKLYNKAPLCTTKPHNELSMLVMHHRHAGNVNLMSKAFCTYYLKHFGSE